MTASDDLTGRRFGRLTITARAPTLKRGQSRWVCLCDCGVTFAELRRRLKIEGSTHAAAARKRVLAAVRHKRARRGPSDLSRLAI